MPDRDHQGHEDLALPALSGICDDLYISMNEMNRKHFLKLTALAPFVLKLPSFAGENDAAALENIFNRVVEKSKAIPGCDVSASEGKWKQLNAHAAAAKWHRVLLEKCDALAARDLSKMTLAMHTIQSMTPALKTAKNPALDTAGAAIQEKWKTAFAKINKLQDSFSKKRGDIRKRWRTMDSFNWSALGRSRSSSHELRSKHISLARSGNKDFAVFFASIQGAMKEFLKDAHSNFQTITGQMENVPANAVQPAQRAHFMEQVKILRDMETSEVGYSDQDRKKTISEFEEVSARPGTSFTKELIESLSAAERKAVLQKFGNWHVDLKSHGSINDTLIAFGFGLEKIPDKENEMLVRKRLQELKDQVKAYQKHVVPFVRKYGNSMDRADVESTLKINDDLMFHFENDRSGARALQGFARSRRVLEMGLKHLGKPDMELWERYVRLNETETGYMSIRSTLAYFENLGTDDLLMKKPVDRGNYSIKSCMQVSGEIVNRLISEQRFEIELYPKSKEARKSQEDIAAIEKDWLSRYSSVSVTSKTRPKVFGANPIFQDA
jgi:hypothetical protein